MNPTRPIPIALLEQQLREGFRWLRFRPELESLYLAERADSVVGRRLVLLAAAFVLVAIAPALNTFLMHPPEAFKRPALIAQFGVMIPALLIATLFTAKRSLRRWQDPVSALAAFVVTIGLLFERRVGAIVGFQVPAELVGVLLLGTAVLAGLRVAYFAPLAVAIIAAFVYNEIVTFGSNPGAINRAVALGMMAALSVASSYLEVKHARGDWLQRKLLEQLVARDTLSSLFNHRHFHEHYPRLREQALREGQPLLVALVDIDYFKSYNDHYGHLAGDDCIQRVAQLLARQGRGPHDIQARLGGDEFALIWYGMSPQLAPAALEALRAEIEALRLPHATSPATTVTVSLGAAHLAATAEAQLHEADQQLYQSKKLGRNRVSVAAAA